MCCLIARSLHDVMKTIGINGEKVEPLSRRDPASCKGRKSDERQRARSTNAEKPEKAGEKEFGKENRRPRTMIELSTLENRWESEQKKAGRQGELPGQHESGSHHGAGWILHQFVLVGDARHC